MRRAADFSPASLLVLFARNPQPMWVYDLKTLRFLAVNDAAVKSYGYTKADFGRMTLKSIRPKADVARLLRVTKRSSGFHESGSWRHIKKDGSILDVSITSHSLSYEGRAARLVLVHDLTSLRRAEERYRALYRRTPVMMHSIDSHGRLLSVSEKWLQKLGYTERDVIGRPSTDFLTSQSRAFAREVVLPAYYRTGACEDIPYQMVSKSGEIVEVLLSATAERDARGRVERSLAVMVDVTEQRRLEREIVLASAREQSKLGRDLHDTVGQTITGIGLLARSLRKVLPPDGDAERQVMRIEELSRGAIGQIRGMARGLVPGQLQAAGLGEALGELAAGTRELFGVDCSASVRGPVLAVSEAVSAQLYMIAQEAVHNAVKHGRPLRSIQVSLRVGARGARLSVTDDGGGIQEPRPHGNGLGLKIMAHRIRSIGGSLTVKRGAKGGTVVSCECPLQRARG